MKTWTKVLLGLVGGVAIGGVAALLSAKKNNDEDYVDVTEVAEENDSDSDEEAE